MIPTENVEYDLCVPPHSISAEQSVLGGIMLENKAYFKIANLLTDNDFYRTDHQLIFRALAEMAADKQPLDVVTVSEWMKGRFLFPNHAHKQSFFDAIGGLAYLADLAKDTPSSANIVAYAKLVQHYSLRRQTFAFATQLAEKAFEKGTAEEDMTDLLEFTLAGAFALDKQRQSSHDQGFVVAKHALDEHLESLKKLAKNNGDALLGAASTLTQLDQQLSGFEQGKVYVVAARPAMGKTTLGLNLVEGIAQTSGGVVGVFSIEMPTEQMVSKMVASQGQVDFGRLRNPWQLSTSDWQAIDQGAKKISTMQLFINDAAKQTPATIRSACYQLRQQTGKPLSAILIDYVQLMHGTQKHYANREAEVAAISGDLRALAKDFACPVIVLSQLNRALESRPDKRPIMSDLRESGALEQDAACIIFIYRDEIYHPKSRDKGIAELIIAKHRGGEIGTVRCAFIGKQQRFANLTAKQKAKYDKQARQTKATPKAKQRADQQSDNDAHQPAPYQPRKPYPVTAKEVY